MTYRFRFQDQYNGEYDLIGHGVTEDTAIRHAVEADRRSHPFPVGGNCLLVPPTARSVEDVCWMQGIRKWRVTFRKERGDYAGMTFCVWSQRGELLPDGQ